jgi:hypothetical protein
MLLVLLQRVQHIWTKLPSLYNRFVTCNSFSNAEFHLTAGRLNCGKQESVRALMNPTFYRAQLHQIGGQAAPVTLAAARSPLSSSEATMNAIAQRLKEGSAALDRLDQMRALTGDREFGRDDEYTILITELWDLEEEILCNPGAPEPMLVPVRRKEHK